MTIERTVDIGFFTNLEINAVFEFAYGVQEGVWMKIDNVEEEEGYSIVNAIRLDKPGQDVVTEDTEVIKKNVKLVIFQ